MMRHNRQLLIIMFTATLIWSAEPVGRNINVDVDHQARVMAAAPVEHVVWDGIKSVRYMGTMVTLLVITYPVIPDWNGPRVAVS